MLTIIVVDGEYLMRYSHDGTTKKGAKELSARLMAYSGHCVCASYPSICHILRPVCSVRHMHIVTAMFHPDTHIHNFKPQLQVMLGVYV